MANDVVHTSDFNGNAHAIVSDTKTYHDIGSDCIALIEAREHSVYWHKRHMVEPGRPIQGNSLLLVAYIRDEYVSGAWGEWVLADGTRSKCPRLFLMVGGEKGCSSQY